MIKDELCMCPESSRRRRKNTSWRLLLLVVAAGLVAAYWAGLTGPVMSWAAQFGLGGGRDLRTPSSRLIGEWESDDDPMFRRICHPERENSWGAGGMYMTNGGPGMSGVVYKIESEDRSGTNLVLAEFVPGPKLDIQVKYSVAEDGKSMTREYDHRGTHVTSRYRYVGPPTNSLRDMRL